MDTCKNWTKCFAWWTWQGATLFQDLMEDGMPKESATTSMLTRRESLAIRFSLDHDWSNLAASQLLENKKNSGRKFKHEKLQRNCEHFDIIICVRKEVSVGIHRGRFGGQQNKKLQEEGRSSRAEVGSKVVVINLCPFRHVESFDGAPIHDLLVQGQSVIRRTYSTWNGIRENHLLSMPKFRCEQEQLPSHRRGWQEIRWLQYTPDFQRKRPWWEQSWRLVRWLLEHAREGGCTHDSEYTTGKTDRRSEGNPTLCIKLPDNVCPSRVRQNWKRRCSQDLLWHG